MAIEKMSNQFTFIFARLALRIFGAICWISAATAKEYATLFVFGNLLLIGVTYINMPR